MKNAFLAIAFTMTTVGMGAGAAQDMPQITPSHASTSVPASMAADLPEGANVIIYRAYAEPTVWAATVKIDGKKLVALGNKKWTAVKLASGSHEVTTGWSFMSGQSGGRYALTVEDGKTHLLEITGTSQLSGAYAEAFEFQMGSGIAEVSGTAAFARVAQCCSFKTPAH